MTKLSIVIPAYNEQKTLALCVERTLAIAGEGLELEIIIVNDASDDGTEIIAEGLKKKFGVKLINHKMNLGKGAALRHGFAAATGEILTVQDADLELDPEDLKKLVGPILRGRADVVYGSRYLYAEERQVQRFWHRLANQVITMTANMMTNRYFTDVQTCYKVFRSEVLQHVKIEENRFGVDPELTIKFSRVRVNGRFLRIVEMPVTYHWRTHDEGKKIGWKDGVRALYVIFKYGLRRG